ncbi:beta-propeller domain-containing protein [Oceanirhabdus seepicola]|uniref:Uncharacterized protein n=1 Tax=Oceanirhabdus seepicola TaxID=2828781 RepID=A0A9J6P3Y9_9CLOT|nr:beta-propeller domain-containing protein [Oceanirhabdus seepicola]MCM1990280.1 hypothetical protein [Oceanirhabdus seepicola]
MNKYIKYLLFITLFSSFFLINKTASAYDLNVQSKFKLENINSFENLKNFEDFMQSLDNYEHGVNSIDNLKNTKFNEYAEYDESHIFRIKGNAVEFIDLSPNNSKVITNIRLTNFNIHNLYIKDDYLIVAGDYLNTSAELSSPFGVNDPVTTIKIFDITILEMPIFLKEFSLSGNLVHLTFSEDSMKIFSKFKPYNEASSEFDFWPYYFIDEKKYFFNENNIYSAPYESTEKNYLCGVSISLKDDISLSDTKAIWGVGQSVYSDDDFIYLSSSKNNQTQIIKLSIGEELFLDNFKAIMPGSLTFYDALNIENNCLKLITTLKLSDKDTFAIYLLDDNLIVQDIYFTNKESTIEKFDFVDDNLFIKYNTSSNNYSSEWVSLYFKDNKISVKNNHKIISGELYYTEDYIYELNITSDKKTFFNMNIYDLEYNLITTLDLTTNNSYGTNGIMFYDKENKLLALPITLKTDKFSEYLLTYKQNDSRDFTVNLISNFDTQLPTNNSNYIDQISEYITINGDYLYTISPNFINVYDLKSNTLITRNKL